MKSHKNSLYRYYRPISFTDFVGQKSIVTILQNQIKGQSFSHALLFSGPRGCGKTSMARIFAKAINCKESSAPNLRGNVPCNQCVSCLQALDNKSLNVIELDGASNNGVEEIRNLIEYSRLSALGVRYKVFIIDEVHMLSKAAFNALLKTLEEPPRNVVFILATTEMDKIPTTINSRCQIFNFRKIKRSEMAERLSFIAQQEKVGISAEAMTEIFYLSEGSLRDALNILQQLMATNNQVIDLDLVQKYFQIPSQQDKLRVLKSVIKGESQQLISHFATIDQRGLDLNLFILGLLDLVKEIIEFKMTGDPEFLKHIGKNETEILQEPLGRYFALGDALSGAFQKNQNLKGDYNYVLIDILKMMNHSSRDAQPLIKNIDSPKEQNNFSGTAGSMHLKDFLQLRENFLSQPRKRPAKNISNGQIFNILINPSKLGRDEMEAKLATFFSQNENGFLTNPQLAQTFIAWYEASIVAVSDCEILVRFDDEEKLAFFQETIQDGQWNQILQDNFQHPFAVYGIDRKRWELIKREFILSRTNNQLKPHHHVTWNDIYGSMGNEAAIRDEFAALATRLFGDLVELEEKIPSNT